MPRYSSWEVFGDGEYAYDDRCDAGEFTTYGQSRGPSSNPYSNGTRHGSNTSSSRRRQAAYDEDGYPVEGGYAGEEDLRRRTARYTMGESTSRTDPHARLGRDSQYAYNAGRRSQLSERVYADERGSDSQRRQQREREREHALAELEYQMQRERRARRDAYSGRSNRRGAVTAENDEFLAYQQRQREQQMRAYEEMPQNVRRHGRGYFPAYEYR